MYFSTISFGVSSYVTERSVRFTNATLDLIFPIDTVMLLIFQENPFFPNAYVNGPF